MHRTKRIMRRQCRQASRRFVCSKLLIFYLGRRHSTFQIKTERFIPGVLGPSAIGDHAPSESQATDRVQPAGGIRRSQFPQAGAALHWVPRHVLSMKETATRPRRRGVRLRLVHLDWPRIVRCDLPQCGGLRMPESHSPRMIEQSRCPKVRNSHDAGRCRAQFCWSRFAHA
jgi:hypothetical protein